MAGPESSPEEVVVTLNLGRLSMNIKVTRDFGSLDKILENCIEAAIKNQEKIRELSKILEVEQAVPVSNNMDDRVKEASIDPSSLTPEDAKHYVSKIPNIVEVTDKSIKFISKEAYDLQGSEAIAVLMYALDCPIKPVEIAELLTAGWNRITDNSVSSYLTNKRYLKPYVAKTSEGYILSGSGKHWVESNILPKLSPKGE